MPVLINPTVFSTISNIRFSGTPFDCCFIPLFFLQTLKRSCSSSRGAVGKWETRQRFPSTAIFSTASSGRRCGRPQTIMFAAAEYGPGDACQFVG